MMIILIDRSWVSHSLSLSLAVDLRRSLVLLVNEWATWARFPLLRFSVIKLAKTTTTKNEMPAKNCWPAVFNICTMSSARTPHVWTSSTRTISFAPIHWPPMDLRRRISTLCTNWIRPLIQVMPRSLLRILSELMNIDCRSREFINCLLIIVEARFPSLSLSLFHTLLGCWRDNHDEKGSGDNCWHTWSKVNWAPKIYLFNLLLWSEPETTPLRDNQSVLFCSRSSLVLLRQIASSTHGVHISTTPGVGKTIPREQISLQAESKSPQWTLLQLFFVSFY